MAPVGVLLFILEVAVYWLLVSLELVTALGELLFRAPKTSVDVVQRFRFPQYRDTMRKAGGQIAVWFCIPKFIHNEGG
jgi:hypothetical protein